MPDTTNTQQHRRLRRVEAAEYLRNHHGIARSVNTLAKYATVGGGPLFRLAGRVPYYEIGDLDTWVDSILSSPMRSTSDRRAP